MSPDKIFLLQQHHNRTRSAANSTIQRTESSKSKRQGRFPLATSVKSSTRNHEHNPTTQHSSSLVRWPTIFHGVDEDIMVDDWEEMAEDVSIAVDMVAGIFAGLVEHVAIFPLYTIQTHTQSGGRRATTASYDTAVDLVSKRGTAFLWRGATTLAWAVVPAHATLFLTYETIVDLGLPGRHNKSNQEGAMDSTNYFRQRVAMVGVLAGIISGLIHDLIMVLA